MSANEFDGLPGTDLDHQIALVRLERRLQDQLDEAFTRIDQMALAQPLPLSEAPVEVALGGQQIPRVSGLSLFPEPGVIIVQFNPVGLDTLRFYEIQVSTNIDFPGGATDSVFNTTDTQFTLAGFDPLTTFFVRVRAIAQTEVGGTLQGQFSTVLNTQTGQVNTNDLADGAVTSVKIGVAAIRSANIADAAIGTAQIGELAVTNANIQNLSIDGVKIQPGAVTRNASVFVSENIIVANQVVTTVASAPLVELPVNIPVLVIGNVDTFLDGPNASVVIRLRRGSTILAQLFPVGVNNRNASYSVAFVDFPSAGNSTYELTARPQQGGVTVSNRRLAAIAITK